MQQHKQGVRMQQNDLLGVLIKDGYCRYQGLIGSQSQSYFDVFPINPRVYTENLLYTFSMP